MKRFFPRPWLAGLLCALALPAWAAFTDNGVGISEEDAVGLIVNGFAKDVLKELPMEFAVEAQKLLAVSLEGAVG